MGMDDERAEYLVGQYADLLLRIGLTWLGDLDDAKDICQTVLIKLLEDPRTFPDRGQERAWVIRLAPLEEGLHLAVETPEPGGLLEQVMALPPPYRQAIFLRYYEGYEVREIAALLGRSPPLVSTHLKRGKEKLRQMLGGTDDERGI